MPKHTAVTLPFQLLLVAALFTFAVDADAKGGGRRSSSVSRSSSSHTDSDGGGSHTNIIIRPSSSSSSESSGASPGSMTPFTGSTRSRPPVPVQSSAPETPEEAEKRAANLTAYEREQAEQAVARKAAAEQAEADRLAADKAAADRLARQQAEERAAAAKVAAAAAKKKSEEAAVVSDVDRVLQRAKADYPMLQTAEGQALLQQILERQKELVARGMYPSVAMVEAISDHSHALTTRPAVVPAARVQATQESKAIAGCRWVTPTQWACI